MSSPVDPKPARCSRCGDTQGVKWDVKLAAWLCHFCWVNTPYPIGFKPPSAECSGK